jgi:putative CocE/NonD family hydrolase
MTDERRFLTMDDGVRIAVTLHTPDHVPAPWPVVFEARPYRKDDISDASAIYRRLCDEGGLAVCRADVRGTGSSEGVALDEYTTREWDDWLHVIAWLAEQPWSNGNVGMFGTSYSGFNSLQVAALRPPALKAIIPIYATDRRFTDDVHYGGGVRRGIDFLDYPMNMVAMNALPPAPSVYGEGWREEWLRRIDANEPWELRWLEEQTEGEYWRHGSVWFEGYERIEAATMIVAGHADGYRNMAFRGFERLAGPKRLLFGPWSHMSPRFSMPGPRIDHVPEMIRWWRRWLAGEDNGVDHEPPIQVFMRRATTPEPDLADHEGEWRAELEWPPAGLRERILELGQAARSGGGGLRTRAGDPLEVRGDVGVTGSIWCAADLPFGSPWDQRPDEANSLVYDVAEPAAELAIAGHVRVELRVSSSAPVPFASAKLCDVFPDGTSAMITRGITNLAHRDGHDRPAPMPVDEPVDVTIELDATAYVVAPGHRLRLDLAGADFPSSWPPPSAGTLTVDAAASRLVLPVLEEPPGAGAPAFAPGEPSPHRPDRVTWTIEDDVLARERRVRIRHGGVRGQAGDIDILDSYGGEIGVSTVDPGRAWATGATTFELAFPEAKVRTASRGTLRTEDGEWHLSLELDVFEGDELIAARRWERTVPRGLH